MTRIGVAPSHRPGGDAGPDRQQPGEVGEVAGNPHPPQRLGKHGLWLLFRFRLDLCCCLRPKDRRRLRHVDRGPSNRRPDNDQGGSTTTQPTAKQGAEELRGVNDLLTAKASPRRSVRLLVAAAWAATDVPPGPNPSDVDRSLLPRHEFAEKASGGRSVG